MGRDCGWGWDGTGAGTRLGQCRTVFLSKKLPKSGQKSHIEYINPNFTTIFKFGSVAQSVARLLCNRKVPGSNPAGGKVLFSKRSTWNLAWLELGLQERKSCRFRPLGGAPVVAGKLKCKQILN